MTPYVVSYDQLDDWRDTDHGNPIDEDDIRESFADCCREAGIDPETWEVAVPAIRPDEC